MPLVDVIRDRLERSIRLYDELAAALPEAALPRRLPGLRSNSVGAQIWCVVGARESYARAIEAGRWAGFSCSLDGDGTRDAAKVRAALARSGERIGRVAAGAERFDDDRHRLLLDLLEHEAAHQGQLIRYLYALDLPIPPAWKDRYALR